ncbi:unnamed protein product [Absidia cylindrospora]
MLVRLPPELLCHVYSLLPPTSVNQISLTCHSMYTLALPSLYSTIILSFRKHIRQLELSLQHNSFLHHVIRRYTKEILLKCKQGGQHRLTFDIRSLLRQLPHVPTLTLVDFHMLPINFVTPLLSLLPQLEHISLRYCDLVLPDASSNDNSNLPLSTTTSLELYWTDFSKTAVNALLSALPSLSKVRLLANHNRHYLANNHALVALQQYCHDVKELAIGLQEVDERTMANCILSFGKQLERLSVRCHSTLILDTITSHAPLVQDLIVRFSLDTLWYSSTTPSSRSQLSDDDDDGNGGLLYLLSHCQQLEHVQIHSMPLPSHNNSSLPTLVRQALASVAQKRCPPPNHHHHHHHHRQQQISPKKSNNDNNNNNDEDDMVHVAATTTRLTIKASDPHHPIREEGTADNDTDPQQQQQQQQQQRGRHTPLVININANTRMYSMDFQQQSAKEHTRMESSLMLDSEQLKEIRSLASLM